MKIVVAGATGLTGSRFVELYPSDLLTPTHKELDITKSDSVKRYFSNNKVDLIINSAAYTNVSEAENQRGDKNGICWQINVDGVKNLLETQLPLIQLSTDMVFSGDSGPYAEAKLAETNSSKVTWYGFTKGEAERLISGKNTILRMMYPVRSKYTKLDYIRKPLQLFNENKLYPLFTDQQVCITFIDEVSMALQKIIEQKATGVFHASSRDTTCPYDLMVYLLTKLGKDTSGLKQSSIFSLNNPVRYPRLGGLRVEETEKKLGIKFSSWKEIIDALVSQGIATP